jgi:hypothetical protein
VIFAAVVVGPAIFGAVVNFVSFQVAYTGIGFLVLTSVFSFLRTMKHIKAEVA